MPLLARDIEFGLDIPANAIVFVSLTEVMEGVEAEAQPKLRRLLRCDAFQGYLFGRPVLREDLEGKLRQA
ncbi:MAG TPA: hypothetical protein VLD59_15830 [Steroidobacteraceae bacterium]|nr:hypothetical protein [Steroidobacteraceae bacterium]